MSGTVTARTKAGEWPKRAAWLAGWAVLATSAPAMAQMTTTLAGNTTSNSSFFSSYFPGQSFTVAGTGDYRNIVFSFQSNAGANVGAGNLYLFTSAYTGNPSSLSSAGALASAAFSNGAYAFGSGLTLSANNTYYAYSDASFSIGVSTTNPYGGGLVYYATSASNAFSGSNTIDARFNVTGTSTAPEPASWGLMIGGFGVAGGALRRRRGAGRKAALARTEGYGRDRRSQASKSLF